MSETFDDGGFADTGIAVEYGVVFATAAEDLDGAFDFLVAVEDLVEFAGLGLKGEVTAVFVEVGCGGSAGSGDEIFNCCGDFCGGDLEVFEGFGDGAFGFLAESEE